MAYRAQEKVELAESSYLARIDLKPNSAWTRVNYSAFLAKLKLDYDKAIEQGKIALKLMDFGMGHYVLGNAYYEKGVHLQWTKKRYKDSRKYFLLAIDHNPYNPDAYYGLGVSYYMTGIKNKDRFQIIKSEEALYRAVQLNPDYQQAKKQLDKVRKLLVTINQ